MTTEIDRTLAKITEDDIRTLEKDGTVCLRGVFGQMWLDLIAEG